MPFDKEALTKKWHGVPMYGWIVGGGLVLGLGYRYYKSKNNATPAATASSTNTPAATDGTNPTSFDTGLPWSGGAPGTGSQFDPTQLLDATGQNASDIADAIAAINASNQQQASDNAAAASSILNIQAENRANLAQAQADAAAGLAAANQRILELASVKPTPAIAPPPPVSLPNVPSQEAQPGIGTSVSSYLPPATVAADAAHSTKSVVGRPGNSGVHGA